MDGHWTVGWNDKQKFRVLQDLVPFWAYFLSLQFTIMQIRATGIADHILPLGDWFIDTVSCSSRISNPREKNRKSPEIPLTK